MGLRAGAHLLPDDAAHWVVLDHLASMVAIVEADGRCLFANTAFEEVLGLSRRAVVGEAIFDWFTDPALLREVFTAVARNEYATSRLQAELKRHPHVYADGLHVQVIVTRYGRGDLVLVELVEVEQQTRQDREERALDQVQANKELIRNLAHEIKNPLGGIRGAAQLLEMELDDKSMTEYTQVIIHEADRLQSLVDRLLAPHRRPHLVGDVNIHEVCERVRSLILAEFPKGLKLWRDYDTSIPEFRGDREQLIQALLNIAHNAAQALAERIAQGDAVITFKTRVARRVTINRQLHRLALVLHIEDNGPGIPESIRDRIFYPLVSGRDGGSGLGLTLAQTFVQQHQGTIECESEPGRTVFKITIPLP
ncbi:PAS domain-containing protein [Aquabacterium fontiphilum]|jgi:two-component system nitrogen regulation sensor histidine kinase GlnL|uniref:nitrogen regulation protein NR(II) n=1 Tax=Aquabacterium fontiphilum TaxID=450365 RepID=UPI001378980C|nr:nitrogen regulation protein NR(II) [Aquabacterium fontiphilum]NBD21000.1 PAS domain-containing protein [Aquabacterium fontiphilum]